MNILIVDDNPKVIETIMDFLVLKGHQVDCAWQGDEALSILEKEVFDVIIMDVMMPRRDGISTTQELRQRGIATPIIFLTARDQLDDKLIGFAAGGDDYLIKPFAMAELIARIEALAMRGRRVDVGVLRFGDLTLNQTNGELIRAGVSLNLGKIPHAILTLLLRNAPRIVSRKEILNSVWEGEEPESDALRSHIYALRNQLDKPFETSMLETVHGQGYRLKA